jgi:hypothetical protein
MHTLRVKLRVGYTQLQAKWLEPMRNLWEGAEGICWLCTAPATQIEPGALYLDRFQPHAPRTPFGEGLMCLCGE